MKSRYAYWACIVTCEHRSSTSEAGCSIDTTRVDKQQIENEIVPLSFINYNISVKLLNGGNKCRHDVYRMRSSRALVMTGCQSTQNMQHGFSNMITLVMTFFLGRFFFLMCRVKHTKNASRFVATEPHALATGPTRPDPRVGASNLDEHA